jgi:hypothetical protein
MHCKHTANYKDHVRVVQVGLRIAHNKRIHTGRIRPVAAKAQVAGFSTRSKTSSKDFPVFNNSSPCFLGSDKTTTTPVFTICYLFIHTPCSPQIFHNGNLTEQKKHSDAVISSG